MDFDQNVSAFFLANSELPASWLLSMDGVNGSVGPFLVHGQKCLIISIIEMEVEAYYSIYDHRQLFMRQRHALLKLNS